MLGATSTGRASVLGGPVGCPPGGVLASCPFGGVLGSWVGEPEGSFLGGSEVWGGDGSVLWGAGASVLWGAGGAVLWVAGASVLWGAGGAVLWVAGGSDAWVLGGSWGCGGLCGAPPPPPGPPWLVGLGGGVGSEYAIPGFTVSAEKPRPAATAAAPTTRFIDIAASNLGFAPRRCLVGPRYGQVTSISNVLVTCCGDCGLLTSVPAAVPLIA